MVHGPTARAQWQAVLISSHKLVHDLHILTLMFTHLLTHTLRVLSHLHNTLTTHISTCSHTQCLTKHSTHLVSPLDPGRQQTIAPQSSSLELEWSLPPWILYLWGVLS